MTGLVSNLVVKDKPNSLHVSVEPEGDAVSFTTDDSVGARIRSVCRLGVQQLHGLHNIRAPCHQSGDGRPIEEEEERGQLQGCLRQHA
jgi:hypothetical protein